MHLFRNLSWSVHIDALKAKISAGLGILYKFKNKLTEKVKLLLYQSLIHSHLTYLPIVYAHKMTNDKLVFNLSRRHSTLSVFREYGQSILPISGLYKKQLLIYVYKTLHGLGYHVIQFQKNQSGFQTRNSDLLHVTKCRLEVSKQRVEYAGPNDCSTLLKHWNTGTSIDF